MLEFCLKEEEAHTSLLLIKGNLNCTHSAGDSEYLMYGKFSDPAKKNSPLGIAIP